MSPPNRPIRPTARDTVRYGRVVHDSPTRGTTHFEDQQSGRLPGETWEEYEDRVLARTSFSQDTLQSNDIKQLEPDVRRKLTVLFDSAHASGHTVDVVETRRSQERQELLFQRGRTPASKLKGEKPVTWTLTSQHTPGRGIDVTVDGDRTGGGPGYQWLHRVAPEIGFEVGDPTKDPGHLSSPDTVATQPVRARVIQNQQPAPSPAPRPPQQPVPPGATADIFLHRNKPIRARTTPLSGDEQEEEKFQGWYQGWADSLGLNRNPDDPRHFYDYRAAYRAGARPNAEGHWPSEFKLPGHPNLIVDGIDTRTGLPPAQAPDVSATPARRGQPSTQPIPQTVTPAAPAAPAAAAAPDTVIRSASVPAPQAPTRRDPFFPYNAPDAPEVVPPTPEKAEPPIGRFAEREYGGTDADADVYQTPIERRRAILRRLRVQTDEELRAQNETLKAKNAYRERALGLFHEPAPPSEPEVGPGPAPARGGMRPSRLHPPLTAEQLEDRIDPFMSESPIARSLAAIRYGDPTGTVPGISQVPVLNQLAPAAFSAARDLIGKTILRPIEAGLGKLPYVGAPFRALEQDLDSRIHADEERERVIRERYSTPVERVSHAFIKTGLEFMGAGEIVPALSIAPEVRAAPEGASLLARGLNFARNRAVGALGEGAKFSLYETGKTLLQGGSPEEARRAGLEGLAVGAGWGGVAGPALEAGFRGASSLLRAGAEGAGYTLREGLRNAYVGVPMAFERAGRALETVGRLAGPVPGEISPVTGRPWESRTHFDASSIERMDRMGREGAFERGKGTPAELRVAQRQAAKVYNEIEAADGMSSKQRADKMAELGRALDEVERLHGERVATREAPPEAPPAAPKKRGGRPRGAPPPVEGVPPAEAPPAPAPAAEGEVPPPEQAPPAPAEKAPTPAGAEPKPKLTRQQAREVKDARAALERARAAAPRHETPEGLNEYLDALGEAENITRTLDRNGPSGMQETLAREVEQVRRLVPEDTEIEGGGAMGPSEIQVNVSSLRTDLQRAEGLIGEGKLEPARNTLDEVHSYLREKAYFGGERELAAVQHRLAAVEERYAAAAGKPEGPAKVEKPPTVVKPPAQAAAPPKPSRAVMETTAKLIRTHRELLTDLNDRLGRKVSPKTRARIEAAIRQNEQVIYDEMKSFEAKFGAEARADLEQATGIKAPQAPPTEAAPAEAAPPAEAEEAAAPGERVSDEELQAAFTQRVTELANDPEWAGRGLDTEDLQALAGLEAALEKAGFKLEPSEFAARFRSLIEQNATGLGGKVADKPMAEYVRILDERLAKAGIERYDVSRHQRWGDKLDKVRLPDELDPVKWREKGEVPRPGETKVMNLDGSWGTELNLTLRRLESAAERALRDAEMLERLGAPKDGPGVTEARRVAETLNVQKLVLEQQAMRARAISERFHSLAAVHRAASLNTDLGQAKIKPSDWDGNRMEPGALVSDGHLLVRSTDVEKMPAPRRKLYEKPHPRSSGGPGIAQKNAQGLWDKAVKAGKQTLEFLGHLSRGNLEHAYLVPKGSDGEGLRAVNAALLRRLQELTKYDELRGPKGAEDPIVAYKNGEPVGIIMPMRMGDEMPFDVGQARRLAGTNLPPPKTSGTAKIRGLTVREPMTVRTPLESNYEIPLQPQGELPLIGRLPEEAKPSSAAPVTPPAKLAGLRARVVRKLSEVLDIPVRIGKYAGFMRRTLGVYKILPEVVRLKIAKDMEVLGHEVGHHIHNLFFKMSSKALRPWLSELKPLAKGISDETAAEGMAEFFRRYLNNPEAAERAAPKFWNYVNQRLATEFPELKTMFEEARAEIKIYNEAGPEARIASNIQSRPTKQWSFGEKFRRVLTSVIDDLDPVDRTVKEIIGSSLGLNAPPVWRIGKRAKWMQDVVRQTRWEENASDLARLVRGSMGTADHWLTRGALDYNTLQTVGPSLEAILRPVSKQYEEFLHYAVSRRSLELNARGKETSFLPADSRAIVQKFGDRAHFQKAFDQLQTYQNQLLAYMRDAGVISKGTFRRIVELNQEYLPFNSVLEKEAARRRGTGTNLGQISNPIKRIKSAGNDIYDPFEEIIKNTMQYTRLAARQRVSNALAVLAGREGAGNFIERVGTPTAVHKFGLSEILPKLQEIFGKRLDLEGLSKDEAENFATEMLAIYRPGDYFGKENMISVLRGKKRIWYEVDPELYQSLMGLNREQAPAWARLFSAPAKLLRHGATLSLEFIARNPIRDQIAAFVQSDYGYIPGIDWGKGLFHLLQKDDLYWKWKAAGGERAATLDLDRYKLGSKLAEVLNRPRTGREFWLEDVLGSPIEVLRQFSTAAEDATRLGEFARVVGQKGTTRAAYEQAAAASREVSVDFARHGAKTEGLRLITAFWNARLQGYARLARAMRENPGRTSRRAAVAITMPSVMLFYVNKDDRSYWARPQWERDLFWHVPIGKESNGDTRFAKIPKPFELGLIFGTIPERILEWAHSADPAGLEKTFTQTFLKGELLQNVPVPTVFLPLMESFFNWNMFRGRPIESDTDKSVQPYLRSEGSSDIAKGIGRMLNLSPKKIDNVLFGWTGGLGRMATDAIDAGGEQLGLFHEEPRVAKHPGDLPGARAFLTAPIGRNSEDVDRFYTEWNEAREAYASSNLLEREGRTGELHEFERNPKNQALLKRYDELADAASELRELRLEIAEVHRDESLTPTQRRDRIDKLGFQMRDVATRALGRRTPATAGGPATPMERLLEAAGVRER